MTLLGIFRKISFTPAVTSWYQVHALNADTHPYVAVLCYLGATGAEISLLFVTARSDFCPIRVLMASSCVHPVTSFLMCAALQIRKGFDLHDATLKPNVN